MLFTTTTTTKAAIEEMPRLCLLRRSIHKVLTSIYRGNYDVCICFSVAKVRRDISLNCRNFGLFLLLFGARRHCSVFRIWVQSYHFIAMSVGYCHFDLHSGFKRYRKKGKRRGGGGEEGVNVRNWIFTSC